MSVKSDSIETYRNVLRHVVRPEERHDRQDSDSVGLSNWEALAFVEAFREYAAYNAPDEEHETIALAYIEYIHMCVHDERASQVKLYAHTDEAKRVILDAVNHVSLLIQSELTERARYELP